MAYLSILAAGCNRIGKNGDIAIFDETYSVKKRACEIIYANMPEFELIFPPLTALGKLELPELA